MEMRRALLCVVLCACGSEAPGKTFYSQNIEPILVRSCNKTSGCHSTNADDIYKRAAGNFDVTSFENVQKRRDVLVPFGPYNYPLLLIKAVGPNQLPVLYGTSTELIQVQHGGGAILLPTSDDFLTLQNWLGNGATENGLPPPTPPQVGTGACSTAVAAGFDQAAATAAMAKPGYQQFVDTVQPVITKHGCNAASCHGAPQSDFYITCGDDDLQKAFNFTQAWSFVNTPVADSQILRIPLAVAAGGRGHTGGDQFPSTDDADYQAVAAWAMAVGVLDFANGDATKQFFKDNVQPILVDRGCSFQACHSPEATNDFKLRSGTPQGFYGAVALEKNYELLKNNFMAIEWPDARRGRAVEKTLIPINPDPVNDPDYIFHRGGAVLENQDGVSADPAACPQPWTKASSPFCTVQEWVRLERAKLGLPLMAAGDTMPIVYVQRNAAATAGRLEFDTFQGGADLRVAQATLGAGQAIASVDVAGSQSLLGGCAGLGASPDVQAPDVANDGQTVAFAARATANDPLEIYTVNINGTGCTQVTQTEPAVGQLKIHNFDPAWSPDGTYIVYASTKGGTAGPTVSRKRFLPASDLWRIQLPNGTPEQMTFLSNSEISPQFMREGRVTMTTEKASDGFYQLSGRRINWDLTDYHPLLAQRKTSAYADLTDLTKSNPSIGFDSATDIREGNDGNFTLILADVDPNTGVPVLKGGAGAFAMFNRSMGTFELNRTDKGYARSVIFYDPTGGASGRAGATSGYRAPFYMPDGTYMVSFATLDGGGTPGVWKVVIVDPKANSQRDLIPNAVDAVLAYPYPAREYFTNHRQLVFGGNNQLADDNHAILHMPDAPMVFTMLTGNLRRGRPVDAFRKATKLHVLTEGRCPPTGCAGNTPSGVFQQRMDLGTASLDSDGSVRAQLPSRTGVILELVDDNGKSIVTMTEEHQLGPSEQISMGVSQKLFDAVCGGCHGSVTGSELDVAVTPDALTGASQSLSVDSSPQSIGN